MTYRERLDLNAGDPLVTSDLKEQVTEATSLAGIYDYRPGVLPDNLAELAWAGAEESHVIIPGVREDPWFDPFIKYIGKGKCVAAILTVNAPPTKVHVDDWTGVGNKPNVFTCLLTFVKGTFEGGEYTLVDYGLGFDLQDRDLLIAASNLRHGNTPRTGEDYKRLTVLLAIEDALSDDI
jgi:hypothetical protein